MFELKDLQLRRKKDRFSAFFHFEYTNILAMCMCIHVWGFLLHLQKCGLSPAYPVGLCISCISTSLNRSPKKGLTWFWKMWEKDAPENNFQTPTQMLAKFREVRTRSSRIVDNMAPVLSFFFTKPSIYLNFKLKNLFYVINALIYTLTFILNYLMYRSETWHMNKMFLLDDTSKCSIEL